MKFVRRQSDANLGCGVSFRGGDDVKGRHLEICPNCGAYLERRGGFVSTTEIPGSCTSTCTSYPPIEKPTSELPFHLLILPFCVAASACINAYSIAPSESQPD